MKNKLNKLPKKCEEMLEAFLPVTVLRRDNAIWPLVGFLSVLIFLTCNMNYTNYYLEFCQPINLY